MMEHHDRIKACREKIGTLFLLYPIQLYPYTYIMYHFIQFPLTLLFYVNMVKIDPVV